MKIICPKCQRPVLDLKLKPIDLLNGPNNLAAYVCGYVDCGWVFGIKESLQRSPRSCDPPAW